MHACMHVCKRGQLLCKDARNDHLSAQCPASTTRSMPGEGRIGGIMVLSLGFGLRLEGVGLGLRVQGIGFPDSKRLHRTRVRVQDLVSGFRAEGFKI